MSIDEKIKKKMSSSFFISTIFNNEENITKVHFRKHDLLYDSIKLSVLVFI
jgi:hypothetical protein